MALLPHSEDRGSVGVESVQDDIPLGEEIVITGMAGKFPESDDMRVFMENLYNKVDMVTVDSRRWEMQHPELPPATGKLCNIDKFDAQFFGVHYKQALCLDPMSRMILETSYAAVVDAGVNPRSLRNTKTGVFVGSGNSESEKLCYHESVQMNGFGLTGCSHSMFPNRISYYLGTTGPSYNIHVTCSSSMVALEQAVNAIRTGQCEAAIVGGINLCLHPFGSLNINRLGFLCYDGKTKVFDQNADGYARSEAISVLYLQKAKNAKRIYAQVVDAQSTYSNDSEMKFRHERSVPHITAFLENFYRHINVSPQQVEYVEAFGIGLPVCDRNELEAIDQVFCKNRKGVLPVGSVKSNLGHSEAASGAVSLTKVCLGYHTGMLAGNLHLTSPRNDVSALREGRVRVATENTPISGYSALNSFSFTGMNVHVLLKGLNKPKDLSLYQTNLPRLVVASGRDETGVEKIFEDLKSRPLDAEEIRLLHSVHEVNTTLHMHRGFTLLATGEHNLTVTLAEGLDYYPGVKRPVWFVYSGMGSQWSGMGADLMRIPIFAAAIQRCHQVLVPKGINLVQVLTDPDPKTFDNILNSFIGIAAVQIGLTDVLKDIGIMPDYIIGHSVGELGCAYADGCFTAEEMIMAAYSRGLVSIKTPLIKGSMAATGLGFKTIQALCPPDIFVACHNGPDSSTISGPADSMKAFVAKLKAKGVFAKEVPCSNIAYHSKYIADAGLALLKHLKEVIKEPKQRSSRWVSTSVPQKQWGEPEAKLSSAEYHTNNLLNPVLFEETSRLIPANAITIEIAPHGLLQAILKRSLAAICTNVPLTRRGHADNVQFLLSAIGKLYVAGLNPTIANLYPTVEYPVSTGTPMLSHLVKWNHTENWTASRYKRPEPINTGERDFIMSVHDDEHAFLKDHVRDGVNVFPEAAQLVVVWETLGMILGRAYTDLTVIFENVRFDSPIAISSDVLMKLRIMIQKSSGQFEITHEGSVVTIGNIRHVSDKFMINRDAAKYEYAEGENCNTHSIYKNLFSKGYSYSNSFQTIRSLAATGTSSQIKWNNEWVTFLDAMIQMNILKGDADGILVPKFIRKVCISISRQNMYTLNAPKDVKALLNASIFEDYDVTSCAGVKMEGLKFVNKTRVTRESAKLEKYDFLPLFTKFPMELKDALSVLVQLAVENSTSEIIQIVEVLKDKQSTSNAELVNNVMPLTDSKEFNVEILNEQDLANGRYSEALNANLLIFSDLKEKQNQWSTLFTQLSTDTFIVSRETNCPGTCEWNQLQVMSSIATPAESIVLLRKQQPVRTTKFIHMSIDEDVSFVETVHKESQGCDRLILITDQVTCAPIIELARNLRSGAGGKVVNFVQTDNASHIILDLPLIKEQIDKNLLINVFQQGKWGSYRYLPICTLPVPKNCIQLTSNEPGNFTSLSWAELPTPSPTPGKITVQVYFAAPTFRDMQVASDVCPVEDGSSKISYGMDFCGVTPSGQRVMGLLPSGALSSVVSADPGLMWPVPEHWSMEDAATVPQAYAHAIYCLAVKSHLRPGMRVLVHGGAGALGQAAISVCLALGCHVLTTVSSVQKKNFLLKMFPQLKESDIGNSREISFEDTVQCATQGRGCDIIISTVNGSFRRASMRCGGISCKLLDVTHGDMLQNEDFNMSYLWKEKVYSSVKLSTIFRPENCGMRNAIQRLVAEGIAEGWVRPLSRVVFPHQQAPRAFRLLAASRHYGRVLLKLRDEKPVSKNELPPTIGTFEAVPRSNYSPEGSYVVVCQKQDLGLELADWLVRRGARNLLVNLLTDQSKRYHQLKSVSWKILGVNVKLSTKNLQSNVDCEELLNEAGRMAPVLGIFLDQNPSSINDITGPGDINVVAHLDAASRKLSSQIEQFVVFTSLAKGTCFNVLADAVAERVCIERANLGLQALNIKLGPIAMFDRATEGISKKLRLSPQSIPSVFNSMETFITFKQPVAASYVRTSQEQRTINNELSEILGKDVCSTLSDATTLRDKGIDLYTANQIKHVLEKEYSIFYAAEKVLNLSLLDLQRLHHYGPKSASEHKTKAEGLSQFFTFVDPDEFGATEPTFNLPTLLSDGTETEDQFDPKDFYLMMIPGMDGHHHVFRTLCQRLKLRAVAYQLGVDHPSETVQQTAGRLLKVMLKKMKSSEPFYLMAYSAGVSVALELAALLEELGHDGTVFCLDGSPEILPQLLDAHIGHLNETQLQDAVVNHMFHLMSGIESENLQRALKDLDWQGKLDACVEHLRGRVKFSIWYKRSVVEMAYKRILQVRSYVPRLQPLRAQLVLIKANNTQNVQGLTADYGLSKYSERPVKVFELDSDHASIPHDLRCSNIVNKHLDPTVLQKFALTSMCQRCIQTTTKYAI